MENQPIQPEEQGNSYAQYQLGRCYNKGIGIGRSPKKAARWYQAAAEQGHPSAVRALEKLNTGKNPLKQKEQKRERTDPAC